MERVRRSNREGVDSACYSHGGDRS